jgi:hypothetical protein
MTLLIRHIDFGIGFEKVLTKTINKLKNGGLSYVTSI